MKVLKFTLAIFFLAAVSSCSYKTCPTYSTVEAPANFVVTTQQANNLTPVR